MMVYPVDISLPCAERLYMKGRLGKKVEYIVVHYTADAGSAWSNAEYARRGKDGDPRISSFHYVIDSSSIFQSVAELDTAWHSGNDDMSERSIGIEVCSLGEDFTPGEIARLSDLVQDIMARRDIPPENVIRHYDVVDRARYGSTSNPHKTCPAPYVPTWGDPDNVKWPKLHAQITGGVAGGEELPMEFIGRANPTDQLRYFCGLEYKDLKTQEQSQAIQDLYRQIHGSSIPMVEHPRVSKLVSVIDGK